MAKTPQTEAADFQLADVGKHHARELLRDIGVSIDEANPLAFVHSGGLLALEREAAKQAIASVRTAAVALLPDLFDLVDTKVPKKDREKVKLLIRYDYRRAHRGAGFNPAPTPDIVRAQTRERVRRFRERQRGKSE